MKESILRESQMGREFIIGRMVINMKGSLKAAAEKGRGS